MAIKRLFRRNSREHLRSRALVMLHSPNTKGSDAELCSTMCSHIHNIFLYLYVAPKVKNAYLEIPRCRVKWSNILDQNDLWKAFCTTVRNVEKCWNPFLVGPFNNGRRFQSKWQLSTGCKSEWCLGTDSTLWPEKVLIFKGWNWEKYLSPMGITTWVWFKVIISWSPILWNSQEVIWALHMLIVGLNRLQEACWQAKGHLGTRG